LPTKRKKKKKKKGRRRRGEKKKEEEKCLWIARGGAWVHDIGHFIIVAGKGMVESEGCYTYTQVLHPNPTP
jgi:hypothetical protein